MEPKGRYKREEEIFEAASPGSLLRKHISIPYGLCTSVYTMACVRTASSKMFCSVNGDVCGVGSRKFLSLNIIELCFFVQ